MEPNSVLLLTGTVNPNGMAFTKLTDTELRRQHYADSINFWAVNAGIPVVFIENSGYDLSGSVNATGAQPEILTFNGNDYDRNLGKGYGEMLCFEYAFENSQYLKKADFIFKVTGRHKVLNFTTFLNHYSESPDINLMLDFSRSLTFSDSRFFGFSPDFFPGYLQKYKHIINDTQKVHFEHVLARAALHAIADSYIFSPMPSYPRIEGSSGSTSNVYDSSYGTWLEKNKTSMLKYTLLKKR